MLSLKQGLSLDSIRPQGVWKPTDEASVEAWYQFKKGITLNGSDVSQWDDSSDNNIDMVQATASEQPAYSSGVLTFVSANDENLQTTGQISLSGNFTIGFRANTSTTNGTVLGDNTTANEFFKYSTASQFRVKIDGSIANITLDSGTFGDDYIVITRISNVLTLYQNGTAQSSTPTLSGTADIDCIGIRATDTNGYDGTIKEIQIFSSASTALTTNVNDRLSTL
jgi:hypothetical protein